MEPVDELCGALREEARACGVLTRVLRDEQEAMIRLRPAAILACLAEREAIQREMEGLARRRREALQALGASSGRATDVLPLLPEEPRERVRRCLRELRGALLAARSLERQNALLAAASLENVSELLAALRPLVPGARYGADARMAALPERTDRVSQRA